MKRARGPLTEELKQRYLDLIADGVEPHRAARAIGRTGTQMRRLRNPASVHYEPGFEGRYTEAYEGQARAHLERLRNEVRERMFDRKDPASLALLKMEAEAHLPEYEHKRKSTVLHGQTGPFQIQAVLPKVTQEALDNLTREELEYLVNKLKELAASTDPQLRVLEGGSR